MLTYVAQLLPIVQLVNKLIFAKKMWVRYDGGCGGCGAAPPPPCWQKANQVSASIWISVLYSGEPQGIQLLFHRPIHLQPDSANVCACESARKHNSRSFLKSILKWVKWVHWIFPLFFSSVRTFCFECNASTWKQYAGMTKNLWWGREKSRLKDCVI